MATGTILLRIARHLAFAGERVRLDRVTVDGAE
jgi:hypothetical protein